jgi:hypothetical protein
METNTAILMPTIYITNKYSNIVTSLRKYYGMYRRSSAAAVKETLQINKRTTTNCTHRATSPCKLSCTYQVNELFLFNCGLPQQCPPGALSYELPVLAGNVELNPIEGT